MSLDKPTGGDGDPDRFFRREDRPFPAAPAEREAAPERPRNTLSMEELRAVYDRAGTLAELQAEARAYEEAQARAAGSSDPSGPASPDSAPARGELAEADRDGAAPFGTRPGVQDAPADRFARPDQAEDLPLFPGAPEDREPAPALPDNAPSMDDVRAMYQKAGSSAELEAMAAEYTAAQKEASAPGLGREQVLDDPDGFFGRPGELQDQSATEPGEWDADERTGPGTGTRADTSPKPGQSAETADEKDGEGQVEDGQEQKPKDLVQHPAPAAETDRPAEAAAEAAPDQQPDDPRITAMERQMERMMATVEAMQEKLEATEARNEALETKHQAETAQLRKEIDELKASRPEQRADAGRSLEDADQPEPPGSPDDSDHGERRDLLGLGDDARDDMDPAGVDTVDNRMLDRAAREENGEPEKPERSRYGEKSMELFKSSVGVLKSAGVSVPGMDLIMGGEDTRRAIEEMEPEEQNDAMTMAYTAGLAFSSLPPATAVAAFGVSAVIPVVRDRFGDIVGKWRGKD